MDITTIGGLLLGFGSMILAILVEGRFDPRELVPFFTNISAFIIIIGGVLGATMLSSKKRDFFRIPQLFANLIKDVKIDHVSSIDRLTALAEKARREGMISLEADIAELDNPMMIKGLRLVVDGTDPELVEAIMQTLLLQRKNDSSADAMVFDTMGGFAPTMGIIGTVMGLVGALKRMSSAGQERTIEALAVAFIATFWGIASANLIFLPMGSKVKARWKDEMILGSIIIEGIMAIQGGNNPRIVRDRLMSYLSQDEAAAADEVSAAAEGGKK
jgi:chemotaxis protein MotA